MTQRVLDCENKFQSSSMVEALSVQPQHRSFRQQVRYSPRSFRWVMPEENDRRAATFAKEVLMISSINYWMSFAGFIYFAVEHLLPPEFRG